jgi:hypothetical protein
MKLKNPSGRIVEMNQRLYDYHKNQEGWETVDEVEAKSTDFTISELREMKDDIDDWKSFTKGDNRKSIDNI